MLRISLGDNPLFSGEAFCELVNRVYEYIVHWKHDLFLVPFSSAGSRFVSELSKLYESFGSASAMECIALKLPWCYQLSSSRNLMYIPSLVNMLSVLNDTCLFVVWVTLIPCLLRAKLSSNIYSILIVPLQLMALESLLVWFSRVRLKLPCGFSLNSP